jgi:tetratricopeptide (TPR) repeat protein
MPFVKKNDTRGSAQASDVQKIFIGRSHELHIFIEHVLQPEDPLYNIISVYGDGGVGKSTLLNRYNEEASAPGYKEYCLTAFVDERQATPASMMERFAEQLHMRSEFRRALQRYKDALRKLHSEQETMEDAVLQHAPDFAGAAVEGVPFVGPLLREGLKLGTAQALSRYHIQRDSEHLDDPIGNLTRAFVSELNHFADTQVMLSGQWTRHRRRVLLFFDTFEQLAEEAAPWLLDHFLTADISNSVVLIVAGRHSIERSLPNDPKRWLPYRDNNVLHSFSLNSFIEEETRAYLEKRGITDQGHIHQLWQLSRGLPLYLSLLTANPQHEVDPTADVVANFLRWIPEHEEIKRRLVLDAALFTLPFNQDDLATLAYTSERERYGLYHWLIKQPFVRHSAQDGHYSYHELAEDLFSRHLFQASPNTYYATRRALSEYYALRIEQLHRHSKEVYQNDEWLSLTVALAQQLFLLPDMISHSQAIEQLLNAYYRTKQDEEITRVLRELLQERPYNTANPDARHAASTLLNYIEAIPMSEEFLTASNQLVLKVVDAPSFSPTILAQIYGKRGVAQRNLVVSPTVLAQIYGDRGVMQHNQDNLTAAIADFDQAIALDPHYAWAYGNRGITYRALQNYQHALDDLNHALSLDDSMDWVYVSRGEVLRHLKEYRRALADFTRAIALDPDYAEAYASRGRLYRRYLKQYQEAIQDLERAITLDPEMSWAYAYLGEVYRSLGQSRRAIEEYDRAIALAPGQQYFWAYGSRGLAYYDLKEYQHALSDLNRAIEFNPLYAWGYSQRGRIYRHLKRYDDALSDLTRAIELAPDDAWSYSHRGLVYISRQEYPRAIEDLSRSIALNPTYAYTYGRRASAYLYAGNIIKAAQDYARDCELAPDDIYAHWMGVWIAMCQQPAESATAAHLEQIAATRPRNYFAYVCRGVAYWLRGQNEQASAEIREACQFRPDLWDAFFWKGLMLVASGQIEGVQDMEHALQLGMFPVLLFQSHTCVSSNEAIKEALRTFSLPSASQDDMSH